MKDDNKLVDFSPWGGVSTVECAKDFFMEKSVASIDGAYSFIVESGAKLDILLDGFEAFSAADYILVCLNGAVSDRKSKKAPFFIGTGLSKRHQLPLVTVADPSLYLSSDLALSWHAGNINNVELHEQIGGILNTLTRVYNKKLVFVAGSGGGFASLAVSSFLECESVLYIWNPQISLASYGRSAVSKYLSIAFDENLEVLQALSERELYEKMDSYSLRHDLGDIRLPENVKLIYMQSKSDLHHVEKHASKFLSGRGLIPVCSKLSSTVDGQISYLEYDWGEGHLPPPPEVTKIAIEELIGGCSSSEVARKLTASLNAKFKEDLDLGEGGVVLKERKKVAVLICQNGSFYCQESLIHLNLERLSESVEIVTNIEEADYYICWDRVPVEAKPDRVILFQSNAPDSWLNTASYNLFSMYAMVFCYNPKNCNEYSLTEDPVSFPALPARNLSIEKSSTSPDLNRIYMSSILNSENRVDSLGPLRNTILEKLSSQNHLEIFVDSLDTEERSKGNWRSERMSRVKSFNPDIYIAIEDVTYKNYATSQLVDAFNSGAIVCYLGDPSAIAFLPFGSYVNLWDFIYRNEFDLDAFKNHVLNMQSDISSKFLHESIKFRNTSYSRFREQRELLTGRLIKELEKL